MPDFQDVKDVKDELVQASDDISTNMMNSMPAAEEMPIQEADKFPEEENAATDLLGSVYYGGWSKVPGSALAVDGAPGGKAICANNR